MEYNLLPGIKGPEDVKAVPEDKLPDLCAEIREKLIETVSSNGGHLASNLGTVELTVALHRCFRSPDDKIIWDVSHQAYTHKLLTGRYGQFSTLRTEGGLSGFKDPMRASTISPMRATQAPPFQERAALPRQTPSKAPGITPLP